MPHPTRRAFTLLDLSAIIAVSTIGLSCLAAAQPLKAARSSARRLKDSTQIRGIVQSQMVWGQNNNGDFVRPSLIDKADKTLAQNAASKDTTANIYSILIYNGFIPTEMCISPGERNKAVKDFKDFHFDAPPAAAVPAQALWDPAFSADFTRGHTGNVSYANLALSGARSARWKLTAPATSPLICDRGPEIKSATPNDDGSVTINLANPKSLALGTFGPANAWSGNVGFADGSVHFYQGRLKDGSKVDATTAPTFDVGGKQRVDLWPLDEAEDAQGVNNYLGVFLKAGEGRGDWAGGWD